MSSLQRKLASPIGLLYLVASEIGLQGVLWHAREDVPYKNKDAVNAAAILDKTEKQLAEYFAGKRQDFMIPFDITGTAFQRKVWDELSNIPYGTTCSYQDIAKRLKNEKACRAVGTANGHNPICIIVPCHRVIAANGTLGGYARGYEGGLEIKAKLLALEMNAKRVKR